MDKFIKIIESAIEKNATDIHLANKKCPVFRINRELIFIKELDEMTKFDLESLLEFLVGESLPLVELFESAKRLDLSYEHKGVRFRINASLAFGVPVFSMRVIRNNIIDVERNNIKEIIENLKKINSGLVLITGKVNSGKTTTLNAFVQHINKLYNKKVVMLEEPIEYTHKSDKALIVQKEVGKSADIPSYYDGLINLLREDADIAVVGEIRDRQTMNVALDLAESGGLVIGTLHTRSCAETIDRIIGMYDPQDQKIIKIQLSTILKMVVSQRLIKDVKNEIFMIPEIMLTSNSIAAIIRQDKFSVSEIQDAIHANSKSGCISFEASFVNEYRKGRISMEEIIENVDEDQYKLITRILGGDI